MINDLNKIELKGRILIEASAGTGKTWNLTGIILRLIIEDKHLINNIIATTFTRAAAAEIRQRIVERLQSFNNATIAIVNYDSEQLKNITSENDWLIYLEKVIAHYKEIKSLRDVVNNQIWLSAINNEGYLGVINSNLICEAAIDKINTMFIGTLDGLCQKWLYEFSLETGIIDKIELNENSEVIIEAIHDYLRNYRQHLINKSDVVSNYLIKNKLPTADDYCNLNKKIINFGRIPLLKTTIVNYDHRQYLLSCKTLRDSLPNSENDFFKFINIGNAQKAFDKRKNFYRKIDLIQKITNAWANEIAPDKDTEDFLKQLLHNTKDIFKTGNDHLLDELQALPFIKLLKNCDYWQKQQQEYLNSLMIKMSEDIFLNMRKELPNRLHEKKEGIFSLQLEKINECLEKENGIILAKYIVHRYPIILIDESQDLNYEHTKLLENTYLKEDTNSKFLLLVGDPKQAIYGFRGGDVANYNKLKKYFPKIIDLKNNYRSSENIINGLNELYLDGNQNAANLGDDIYYQRMNFKKEAANKILEKNSSEIKNPVIWITTEDKNEEQQLADIIENLIATNSKFYTQQNNVNYNINAKDITVLMRNNKNLLTLHNILNEKNIENTLNVNDNIFAQEMAKEIIYLLNLIIKPYNKGLMNRVLGGMLFNFSQEELSQFELENNKILLFFIKQISYAHDIFLKNGLFVALQAILGNKLNYTNKRISIWHNISQLPYPKNYRYLLDLRLILHIISKNLIYKKAKEFLDWWQFNLDNNPESEWAKIYPLPGSNAVQLMTIHKSKGLQSPIVIVGKLGDSNFSPNNQIQFHAYHNNDGKQSNLSITLANLNEEQQQIFKKEKSDEQKRLLYVALTRAEELLLISKKEKGECSHAAMSIYRESETKDHFINLERKKIIDYLKDDSFISKKIKQENEDISISNEIFKKDFIGWGKTSFSALHSNYAKQEEFNYLVNQEDYKTDNVFSHYSSSNNAIMNLPFFITKGVTTGIFLHKILQYLPKNKERWNEYFSQIANDYKFSFEEQVKNYKKLYADIINEEKIRILLTEWLTEILTTKLQSSTTNLQYILFNKECNMREWSFMLAIDDNNFLDLQRINNAFEKHNIKINLNGKTGLLRFLRGEIDLIYYYKGKYFIIDYKSNYLGDNYEHYQYEYCAAAMNEHCYWLQAAIYQLALHRFLRCRLPNYDAAKHLGAVEYLFLRAINSKYPNIGRVSWSIPLSLLYELDSIFGLPLE